MTRWGRILLVFPALSAAMIAGVLLWAAGVFDVSSERVVDAFQVVGTFAFLAWNLLPSIVLAALIAAADRHYPRGLPVLTAGCATFVALTTWLVIGFVRSESSTAALVFLSLPVVMLGVLLPFAVATWAMHRIRGRASA